MSVIHEIRRLLWKFGYDISRFNPADHPLARRKRILETFAIDTVLDVGANTGQFARQLRHDLGFLGRILSFEPASQAFEALRVNSKGDPTWEVYQWALGDIEGTGEINLSANTYSSSIFAMLPSHSKSAPDSKYIGKESITIRTVDCVFRELCGSARNVYLKIDTQGFEYQVLKGAEASLRSIETLQIEMSLVPLYQGSALSSRFRQNFCRVLKSRKRRVNASFTLLPER